MEKATIEVKGMSCNHCVSAVEGSVSKLDGIQSVKVNLEKGLVDVSFNNKEVSLSDIKEEIEDQGYDVV
ncbi:copper chaperone CopZ [Halalkalibacter krulwichiae]|uniref:Copper chaperone CopZ n=1 Tax=Halalkalibacter krulwichiae TaxID=199441 RepID=A0A1X9MF16_9BACI|nr:copper chaperone CopZ [Halalkalibacter krulwichiae]ARK30713.1 Copper chaperone CopZ [Halalkalibacter krulwichiae]